MKKTIKIAKLELSNLFYSPIAWLLFVIFIIQSSINFTDMLEALSRSREYSGINSGFAFLTKNFFCRRGALFPQILSDLYLYIPLLTMGLISREVNSGTISLLYSSPVKMQEIVFGKFLAVTLYNIFLILILLVYVSVASFAIREFDFGIVFSALTGIFLLLCTYSAIGLFMSCLTGYQIVAAISTFVAFAVLQYIGGVWQGIDFVRDLTYFLSITGRTENMVGGLITTKDIFYFIIIICMFLVFGILKLKSNRETRPWFIKAGQYFTVVIIALTAGYITSRPVLTAYRDATQTKTNTLTENTRKIVERLKEPLQITSYINLLDRHYGLGAPEMRNTDLNRWLPYIRFKKDLSLKYVYYYDSVPDKYFYTYGNKGLTLNEIAAKTAKLYKTGLNKFLTPEEIHKVIDLKPEGNSYVMQLQYGNKKTFLRLFNDAEIFPSETEVSAALKRLTVKLPVIGFLEGDYERSPQKIGDRDYRTLTGEKSFRYALINQGFNIETFNPDSTFGIPGDISVLVIADPRSTLNPKTFTLLKGYISSGGNLVILGEPGKQSVLNPLLSLIGVQLMPGQIVQRSSDFSADLILPYLTPASAAFSKTIDRAYTDSARIAMSGVAGLSYNDTLGFTVSPLLIIDSTKSWNRTGHVTLDSAAVSFDSSSGDVRGSFPVALSLMRKVNGRQQKIIVTGDADLMSNAGLGQGNVQTANFNFNTALFGWFTEGEFPVETSRPKPKDIYFVLNENTVSIIKVLLLWIFPACTLLIGSVLLIRRKRK